MHPRRSAALRKGTIEGTAIPCLCGTAYKNKGVQKLLDAVIEYMPAPTDIPDITGVDEDGNEVVRKSSDEEPFSALAFKIMTDPFVGKLAFFRVYSGTLNAGSYVLNANKNKKGIAVPSIVPFLKAAFNSGTVSSSSLKNFSIRSSSSSAHCSTSLS